MKDGKPKRPGLLSSFIRHLQPQTGKGDSKVKPTERPGGSRDPVRSEGGDRGQDGHGRHRDKDERKGKLRDEQGGDDEQERDEEDREEESREAESDDFSDAEGAREQDGDSAPERSHERARTRRGRTADDDGRRDETGDARHDGRRASRSRLSG